MRAQRNLLRIRPAFVVAALTVLILPANATELTFDGVNIVPSSYGDYVTSTQEGLFGYGAARGFTPHVSVDVVNARSTTAAIGDLNRPATLRSTFDPHLDILIQGTEGRSVRLHQFDLAADGSAFFPADLPAVIDEIIIRPATFNPVFQQANVVISHSGRTTISFDPPLESSSFQVTIDVTTLASTPSVSGGTLARSWGIDNVQFSEVTPFSFTRRGPVASLPARTSGPRSRRISVADIDGDGDDDVITVRSGAGGSGEIGWSENLGGMTFGSRRVIHADGDAVSADVGDLDGDGDLDVVVAWVGGSGDRVAWYPNLGGGIFGDPATNERLLSQNAEAAAGVHTGDFDGDGDLDVVAFGAVGRFFRNGGAPADPTCTLLPGGNSSCWPLQSLPASARFAAFVADVDLDGDLDIQLGDLSSQADEGWLKNVGGATGFVLELYSGSTTNFTKFPTAVVNTDLDFYPEVLSIQCGEGKVGVHTNRMLASSGGTRLETSFNRYLVSSLPCPESAVVADLNQDGRLDLIVASRNDAGICSGGSSSFLDCDAESGLGCLSGETCGPVSDVLPSSTGAVSSLGVISGFYRANNLGNDRRFVLADPSAGGTEVHASDLDLDGDLDLVAAFNETESIELFENRLLHRPTEFGAKILDSGIPLAFPRINDLVTTDLDQDGDVDIAVGSGGSAIDWYRNDGSGQLTLAQQVSGGVAGLEGLTAGDLDGDGDADLLAAHEELSWLENIPPPGAAFGINSGDFGGTPDEHVIAAGPAAGGFLASALGDLDGDGDLDVVAGGIDTSGTASPILAWYENDGTPADGGWTSHSLPGSLSMTTAVVLADVDKDGDLDILTTAATGDGTTVGASQLVWFRASLVRSTAGNSVSFTQQPAIPTLDGARAITVAADQEWYFGLAGDGDRDILVAADNGLALHENRLNEATADFGPQQQQTESSSLAFRSLLARDFDRDGAEDLLLSVEDQVSFVSLRDSIPALPGVPAFAQSLGAADLDLDGDLDAISLAGTQLTLHPNDGFAYLVRTRAVFSGGVAYEGETVPLFEIDVILNALPGDPSARVEVLDVTFRDGAAQALTTTEIERLIRELRVYRDDGDGSFDASQDVHIATISTLTLENGTMSIPLPSDEPNAIVAAPATFFLLAQVAPGASAWTPKDFVALLPSGVFVRETVVGAALEAAPPEPSEAVTVVTAPVVGSFLDVADLSPGDGTCDAGGGGCTLRAALQEANLRPGPDRIVLQVGTYTLTLAGALEDAAATGDLDILDDLTILGAGPGVTVIDAAGIDRVFDVLGGSSVVFEDLTISGGDAPGAAPDGFGGGLRIAAGVGVELRNTVVERNVAVAGGGISNEGSLEATDTAIRDNTADQIGGGTRNAGALTLAESLVDGNAAPSGGGIHSTGSVDAQNTTITGNQAAGNAGGLANEGTAVLRSVTVSANTASTAGGMWNCDGCGAQTQIESALIAGNSATIASPDCSGTFQSLGYNLIRDGAGCGLAGTLDGVVTGIDPLLGPLQDNGGATATRALAPGSPAIDTGRCTTATDQRGFARVDLEEFENAAPDGNGCDIGAYEVPVGDALPRLDVPIRWCVLEGSPSFDFASPTVQEQVNDLLRSRHENASINVFESQASIRLTSAANINVPDYPIIPDPVVSSSCPAGNVVIDPSVPNFKEFGKIIGMCRRAWESIDPLIKGVTAVNIDRFVDPDCNPLEILGLGGRAEVGDAIGQMAAGRVMVVDLVNRDSANPPDLVDRLLAHEVGHGAGALRHGDGIDNEGSLSQCRNGIIDDDDDRCENLARFDGKGLMQYRSGSRLTLPQVQQMRDHIASTFVDFNPEPLIAALADDGDVEGEFLNVLDFEFLNVLDFEFLNVLDFEFLNVLDFEFLNVLDFEFLNVLDFGMEFSGEEPTDTTTFWASTAGLPWPTPVRPEFVFFWNVDLDMSDATGGQPSLFGFPGGVEEELGVDLIVGLNFTSDCDAYNVCTDFVSKAAWVWDDVANDGFDLVFGPTDASGEIGALTGGLLQETTEPEEEDPQIGMLLRPTVPNSVLLDALNDSPGSDYFIGDPVDLEVVSALTCEQILPDGTVVDCQCTDCAECPEYPGCEVGGAGTPQALKQCTETGDPCVVNDDCGVSVENACADGSFEDLFENGMVGCAGRVSFSQRESLCGPGFHACAPEQWVANRGGAIPSYHYFTSDQLLFDFTFVPTFGWIVGRTGRFSCGSGSAGVCTNSTFDPLSNTCSIRNAGWQVFPPDESMGACLSVAGTLCCPDGAVGGGTCSGEDTFLVGDDPGGLLRFEPPVLPRCEIAPSTVAPGDAVTVIASNFPTDTGGAMKVLARTTQVGFDASPVFDEEGSTTVGATIPEGSLSGRLELRVVLEGDATTAQCFVEIEFPCEGDPSTGDSDEDGFCNDLDNCVNVANPDQLDSDADGEGDLCDVCPFDPFNDADGDEVCGDVDNCPSTFNPDQLNADGDTFGDLCDECPDDSMNDEDLDGICVGPRFGSPKTGGNDNCPLYPNPDQANWDTAEDSIGDACDSDPILGDLPAPAAIDEGSTVTLEVDATAPPAYGGSLEYRADCDGDGTIDVGPQASASLVCPYDDDTGGPFNATVTVKALATGDESTQTTLVTVNGVAPEVGAITAPLDPVALGTPIDVSVDFTDVGTGDTHTADWSWGDGTTTPGTVDETDGSGTVTGQHTYPGTGVYTVTVTVADDDGLEGTATFQFVVIYDPSGGFVTGGGFIDSPPGAYTPDATLAGKANFGFVAKYQQGATTPTGNTVFEFKVADLKFKSLAYEWLVVAGAKAQYKGVGTINGQGNYGFLLFAVDENLTASTADDLFRIKIWDKNAGDAVVYDNELGAPEDADATTAISGGSIVIHKP